MEVKKVVSKKIKEHKVEIETIEVEQEKVKSGLEKAKQEGVHALMVESNKMLILKDRIMFHKACIMAYEDLLKELGLK